MQVLKTPSFLLMLISAFATEIFQFLKASYNVSQTLLMFGVNFDAFPGQSCK